MRYSTRTLYGALFGGAVGLVLAVSLSELGVWLYARLTGNDITDMPAGLWLAMVVACFLLIPAGLLLGMKIASRTSRHR